MEIADIARLAKLAHSKGCLLAVDNVFCTPALQQPLKLGADIVVHSATKYIDGQGRCVGGAIVGSKETGGQRSLRFPAHLRSVLKPVQRLGVPQGVETLSLRMKAHSESALVLAQWLEKQPKVKRVYYPGLASHPQHTLAKTQQSGFGGIVSFEVEGGQAAAWRVIDSTRVISITANLGDAKSTITHPATTTHGRLTDEQRRRPASAMASYAFLSDSKTSGT